MPFSATSALLFLLSLQVAKAFEIKDIAPDHKVAAQIGDRLVLSCRTTGCPSPDFSWRTQMDNPLGGITSRQGSDSFLTLASVGFEHEHNYLCNAICGNERRERRVQIEIYSFPSDPVIEISGPLVLGKPSQVICRVPKVYPSERLVVSLKRDGEVLKVEEFFNDEPTRLVETKTVNITFTPTEEDIGKEITCIAELPIEELEFEPKQRQARHRLDVNFGPQNTHITASPGNNLLEGEALMLSCGTQSHPPAKVVWKKQLANETIQHIAESSTLSIPNAQFWDSGIYVCETTNAITNEVENRTVSISVQGAPRDLEFSILPASTVQEGESVTLKCSAKSDPAPKVVIRRKSDSKTVIQGGLVYIPSVSPDDAGDYECQVENQFGENKMTRSLIVQYAPKGTIVTVTPSNIIKEGDHVTMFCFTDANPTPWFSWKKLLADGSSHLISQGDALPLKNIRAEDMGRYGCEVINEVGKDLKAVELIVEAFSSTIPTSTAGPEIITEMEDFTIKSTAYNTPQQEADHLGNKTSPTPKDMLFTSYTESKNNTITYVVDNSNDVSNDTEDNKITIAKMEEPDYMIPTIIVVSSLATAAGPMAAILIYFFRKTKINGSYSLGSSLKPKV
ncbi:vascular cell adhesion protein 1 [Sceloporus undulatus]|uniref:vascular cell adhesion protein 1 n=1 Tax=Sceloporus undulatus TaxID=8520 RepID=UPI001C4C4347|nr:vascular cell adhesion protein 1 [Sceloporus undulatus]